MLRVCSDGMEIISERLLLREYVAEDETRFMAYHADPRAHEFSDPASAQPDRARALVPLFLRWAAEVPRTNWQLAIAPRSVPEGLIGSAGLRQASAPPGVAEFGLELAPAHWGKGYATEAARALLGFGFNELGLEAVRGTTVSANTGVTKLVQRLGFRRIEESEGSAWLAARGWREVTWELRREKASRDE